MFESPWETFASMCTLCTVYTLTSELSKNRTRQGAQSTMSLAALQSLWQVAVYAPLLSWSGMRKLWQQGVLYTLNVWMPVLAQWLGCDSLTMLMLKMASPVLVGVFRAAQLSICQWIAIALATACTGLVSAEQWSRPADEVSWLAILAAIGGTVSACGLSVLQDENKAAASDVEARSKRVRYQLVHMHAWALPTFVAGPQLIAICRWTWAAPWWLSSSATITQGLCSLAIVHVNSDKRLGAAGGQIGQVLRRAICIVIVAYLYERPVTNMQLCGLACAMAAATLFAIAHTPHEAKSKQT